MTQDDGGLLKLYSGVMTRENDDYRTREGGVYHGQMDSGRTRNKLKQWKYKQVQKIYTACVSPAAAKRVEIVNDEDIMEQHWDLDPIPFGNTTPSYALNKATDVVATSCALQNAAEISKSDIGHELKLPNHKPNSIGLDILVTSIMQTKLIRKQRRRDYAAKIQDCIKLFKHSIRKSSKILLNDVMCSNFLPEM